MTHDVTTSLLLAIVPAVAALSGVAMTAAIDALKARKQFEREKQWSVTEEQKKRLEEAFVAASNTEQAAGSYVLAVSLGLASGKMDNIKVDAYPRGQLAMLVGLHLPNLRDPWTTYDEIVQAVLSTVASALLSIGGRPEQKAEATTSMMRAYGRLAPAQRAFEAAVSQAADSLASERLRALGK